MYFLEYFDQKKSIEALEVLGIYQDVLRKCKKALGTKEDYEDTLCPRNIGLTKDWMLVIPRRTGMYEKAMVNAAVMGMSTVANEKLFAIWRKIGPSKVLGEFGLLRNYVEAGSCERFGASAPGMLIIVIMRTSSHGSLKCIIFIAINITHSNEYWI